MSSEEECLICFENIDDDAEMILDCNHRFHENCILEWYQVSTQKDCPVCRTVITTINDNDTNNDSSDIDNNIIVMNNHFNRIVFSWQRGSLLLFIPANIFLSVVSMVYNVNIIITCVNVILDCISYIGTYTLEVSALYSYIILYFFKATALLSYYSYEFYNQNGLYTGNDLIINDLLLFLTSEVISLYMCIMINDLISKINDFRRIYIDNV